MPSWTLKLDGWDQDVKKKNINFFPIIVLDIWASRSFYCHNNNNNNNNNSNNNFFLDICCGLNLVLVQNFSNWFNFYFLLLCIHYHNVEQGQIKLKTRSKNIKPRTNLNHNTHLSRTKMLSKPGWAKMSSPLDIVIYYWGKPYLYAWKFTTIFQECRHVTRYVLCHEWINYHAPFFWNENKSTSSCLNNKQSNKFLTKGP